MHDSALSIHSKIKYNYSPAQWLMFNGLKGHDYPLALNQFFYEAAFGLWLHALNDKNDLCHNCMAAEVTAAVQFRTQCLDVTRTPRVFDIITPREHSMISSSGFSNENDDLLC